MNIKKVAFLLLSFSVAAFAGKVITYTASSGVSQEQANNTAIAGVAKQVSSDVVVDDRLNTTDVTADGKETISQSYSSKKRVTSRVNIKWISVRPLPKEGGRFRALATLDVDEMTNNIRLQMADIKDKIARLEADGRAALKASRYDEAVRCYTGAQELLQPYADLKAELAEVFTLDRTYNLEHDLEGLKSLIASRLGNLKVEASRLHGAPLMNIALEGDYIDDLVVSVLEAGERVKDFPLKALQEGKRLDSRRTQGDGSAVFTLRGADTSRLYPEGLARPAGVFRHGRLGERRPRQVLGAYEGRGEERGRGDGQGNRETQAQGTPGAGQAHLRGIADIFRNGRIQKRRHVAPLSFQVLLKITFSSCRQ